MRLSVVLLITNIVPFFLLGQESLKAKLYGYIEPYFCFDFNEPVQNTRAGHIYSFNRHNEVSVNIGVIGVGISDSTYRGNFSLMSGSYAMANLANERSLFQHAFEANAGIRLRRKNNVWIDAGVLPSHIGFESAIGANCATLSRSILADNTPYFETGLKVSGTSDNRQWTLGILALNGWQRIQQRAGNSMISIGTQITYAPNDNFLLNSSSYAGTDEPDSTRKYRYFHNLYAVWNISEKFQITPGFDIGLQQRTKYSSSYSIWHGAVLISSYRFSSGYSAAFRVEYYHDPENVIVNITQGKAFSVFSYSANMDYRINDNAQCRVEFRAFHSAAEIYQRKGAAVANDFALCGAICISI